MATRLRVLTYNIHRAIGLDRRFRPERIVRIVDGHDADVVLLQEVDDGVPRSRELDLGRELARSLGYPHVVVGHNVALRKGRYGNAILSRHPILRERNIDLTIGLRKRRGCQHATIGLRGGATLEVFNVHLGLSARERGEQVRKLFDSRELWGLGVDQVCLVGGDFNDWRSLLRPLFLERQAFRCVTDRSRSGHTFPSIFPQGGLDTIYYRGPLRLLSVARCKRLLSRVASDHLPLRAEFEL
jgi:endonuclease/exonuclease/phosphatase family metal-dependent hydrolase